jgi:DHA1 family inner membrane transport protein
LPNIANDLGISIPTAGMLITGYALGVMLGAPFMTYGLVVLHDVMRLFF